jgi:hypothetical protein
MCPGRAVTFVTGESENGMFDRMTAPSHPPAKAAAPADAARHSYDPADLEDELRSAVDDFERGDYIELTDEQLARCIATGESPWPDESRS